MTRLKIVCSYVNKQQDGSGHLSFNPVYSGSEENKQFFAATPGGNFQFYTVNKAVVDEFEQGKEYYMDIHQGY